MSRMGLKKTILYRWMGVNAIMIAGLVHLYIAPLEFHWAPVTAILSYAQFPGLQISTPGIALGGHLWGWVLGGFIAGGVIVYLISRAVGLPSLGVQTWRPPLAYIQSPWRWRFSFHSSARIQATKGGQFDR